MPKAARKTDMCSGHGCFPPSSAIGGSFNVFINRLPALRVGDAVAPHGCPDCPPHPRAISAGSPSVFVNGIPLARVGDGVACGGSVMVGSANVVADERTPGAPKPIPASASSVGKSGST
ncbi:MAG: hypothetical protein CR964_00120 [Rhodobacterales bacterium]|nr:MAG: hypothetical protein CR964_00120 [Rhodobacterales bacterium]